MPNKEDELLKNRIKDLADRSYRTNVYTFTDFLSMADAAIYYEIERDISYVDRTVYGGYEDAERVIVRFGSTDTLGYEEDFPIKIVRIAPLMLKFADDLTHRDILGSLMNLGIDRAVLGDILIENSVAYIFVLDSIAEYICDNITKVKHTSVMCEVVDAVPDIEATKLEDKNIQIQSERLDAVIAKAYNLSRSQCIPLFNEKRVFVNGRVCENNSHQLKAGDRVTVRGSGRFVYKGVLGTSKKGKLNAIISI